MFSKKLRRSLILLLSCFILLGLYTKLVGPIEFRVNQVSTQKTATFDVSGEGSVTVIPDQAEVTLGITVNRATVAAAKDETNQVINQLTQALKDNGVGEKNIHTANYSINPDYDYRSGNNRITGYTVSVSLLVKFTDFDKLNQAIDRGVALGANQVGGVAFTLTDAAKAKAETEARQQAVAAAKQKADSLAKAAGIQLGRIVNVQENSFVPPRPIYALETASAEPSPTQLPPGTTEVKLTVTLSYETL